MRKSMLALGLGFMIAAAGFGGNAVVSQAAEVPAEIVEVSAAEEAATQGELQCVTIQADLLQEGSFQSVRTASVNEEEVLYGEATWEATFKQRLVDGMRSFQTIVSVEDLGIAYTDVNNVLLRKLYSEVVNSNPDLFYATNGFMVWYYPGGNVVEIELYYDGYTDVSGNIDMTKINAYKAALNRAMSVVKDGMSDVEKVLALHDYLVLNCDYDWENYVNGTLSDSAYSSYGALVNKSAVCQGYAMAYAEMLRTAGLNCYVVASNEMNHAWNMVYLDGAWYHIDATNDDPLDELTEGADYKDEGAVAHWFFLKSDAEMQKEGYKSWFEDYTYELVPAAEKSDAFSNMIFAKENYADGAPVWNSAFTFYGGYWYYVAYTSEDGYGVGQVVRSKIDGSDKAVFGELGNVNYLQIINGQLFFADDLGAYTTLLSANMQRNRIMTMVGSKTFLNCEVSEFVVYGDGTVALEIHDVYGNTYIRKVMDVNTRETTAMPTFTITKMPTINYPENPGTVRLDGECTLRYSDGTKFVIQSKEIKISHDDMVEEKVYDVMLEWKGLTATYQVSLKKDFPIADVLATETNWKYNGIKFVYDNKYMNGVDANHFAPDQTLTRAMLVQILYNMEGAPAIEFKQEFPDVTSDKWYAKAVVWAYENNIASGYDNGKFGAEDNITREQAAVMLKKYAELEGIDTAGRADLTTYTDCGLVHDWAMDALSWANHSKVINGKLGGVLDPRGNATRAEMAAMITNFCNNVYK